MRKIFLSFLFIALSFGLSIGKPVDENTAKNVGVNFYKSQGIAATTADFSLVYTATSVVSGATITDFYVFSHSGAGFIMVSGDDIVKPVLGWSNESSFAANNIPVHVAAWFNGYIGQINNAVKNNVTAFPTTAQKWSELLQSDYKPAASRTTAGPASPLVLTYWDQSPYFNDLCPFDYSSGALTVTGCVATAMAQVMKYWSWPKRGIGSNSYATSFGTLSANFGTRIYQWDSMPVSVLKPNLFIATLMSDAGISVDMNYGVTGSSAEVLATMSYGGNCTEDALENYFSYKKSIHDEYRSDYTDTNWVHMLKVEIDAKRPVIYTGYGTEGGHCFVADGYNDVDMFHFNWGWGFSFNGYYAVEALAPGGTDFTSDQGVLAGVEPDSAAVAAVTEISAGSDLSIYPNPAKEFINIDLQGTKTTAIRVTDIAGREMKMITPAGNASVVTVPVNDLIEGMYFIELQTTDGVITKKVVVSR